MAEVPPDMWDNPNADNPIDPEDVGDVGAASLEVDSAQTNLTDAILQGADRAEIQEAENKLLRAHQNLVDKIIEKMNDNNPVGEKIDPSFVEKLDPTLDFTDQSPEVKEQAERLINDPTLNKLGDRFTKLITEGLGKDTLNEIRAAAEKAKADGKTDAQAVEEGMKVAEEKNAFDRIADKIDKVTSLKQAGARAAIYLLRLAILAGLLFSVWNWGIKPLINSALCSKAESLSGCVYTDENGKDYRLNIGSPANCSYGQTCGSCGIGKTSSVQPGADTNCCNQSLDPDGAKRDPKRYHYTCVGAWGALGNVLKSLGHMFPSTSGVVKFFEIAGLIIVGILAIIMIFYIGKWIIRDVEERHEIEDTARETRIAELSSSSKSE